MGRKRVLLTPEQEADRKRRYWGEDRNAKRRAQYAANAELRRERVQEVRESYRRSRIEAGEPVRIEDCRDNLPQIDVLAKPRGAELPSGRKIVARTLFVDDMGKLLGRTAHVLYRWMSAGMFPRPPLATKGPANKPMMAYSAEQAERIMHAFAAHQQASIYYRSFHEETKKSLFAAAERGLAETVVASGDSMEGRAHERERRNADQASAAQATA